jgi:hypothetical protein
MSEWQHGMDVITRNVLVDKLGLDVKAFDERTKPILQSEVEIWKFDSFLIADFLSTKSHLFMSKDIYLILLA